MLDSTWIEGVTTTANKTNKNKSNNENYPYDDADDEDDYGYEEYTDVQEKYIENDTDKIDQETCYKTHVTKCLAKIMNKNYKKIKQKLNQK